MEPAPFRYADRPMPLGTRLFGLGGTTLVCALVLAAALFKWVGATPVIVPTTLSVFDVAEPEAPPAPDTEIPPGPEQVQKEKPQVEVVKTPPPPLVQVPSASSVAAPPKAVPVDDPGPPVDQTTAPQSSPKPPGAKSSDAKPTWEGQVLAALNAAKRYPLEAKRNRQQGMPWVRFTIDRDGRVRSARIARSSGFDALDREAEALPLRASPLPKPPESVKGDRIELTVPIEFFLAGGG
ncbi:TonB family domain-containing protein [Sphingobium cloacae]|uniref:TonB family domain-containing protein n=3 Tax=Sphingobium cloacae TaxID=120107 RepID=A0A1E1F4C5_9SPHN|nr:TonB family domain-containing protein [Sphingobium cloacae]